MRHRKIMKWTGILSFLVIMAFTLTGGCNDDDNGEADFREFVVLLFEFEFGEDALGPCSQDTAGLILRLLIDDSQASAVFELKGFGRIGPETHVTGMVENSTISFQPFSVSVDDGMDDAPFGPSVLDFSFDTFSGTLIDINGDQFPDEIRGSAIGSVMEAEGDAIFCLGAITAEFLAIAEDTCLEQEDLMNAQCPAFELPRACAAFFCGNVCEPSLSPTPAASETPTPTPCFDFVFTFPTDCQVVDCNTLDCGQGRIFNNLQISQNGLPSWTDGQGVRISCTEAITPSPTPAP